MEVDHKNSKVADENQAISNVAELVGIAWSEVAVGVCHVLTLVEGSNVLLKLIHRVVNEHHHDQGTYRREVFDLFSHYGHILLLDGA